MDTPRRNDPCPCGSGLKFKKCCMIKDPETTPDPTPIDEARVRGYKLMADRKWEEAIEVFKEVLREVPDSHVLLDTIGACYDGLEDYLRAAEYFERAIAVCPEAKQLPLYYRLGVARGCAQRIPKAKDAFGKCLELEPDPERHAPLRGLLDLMDRMEDGSEPRHTFFVQMHFQRAFSEIEAELYPDAAARLERLRELAPDDPAISYNLGVVYALLKQQNEAMSAFARAVELDPRYAEAWYNMGQISLIMKKDFSRALHCFDRAVSMRHDYIGAHHQRGIAYELLGDPEKALECWEKTLQLDPGNKQAQDNIDRVRGRLSTS